MELRNYKLFIYEDINYKSDNKSSIREEYWKQLESEDRWVPITFDVYNSIYENEWMEDLISLKNDIDPDLFVMKELDLTERHRISLIRLDDFISNYFINFEMELKEKQERPRKLFLYTSFEEGKVFVIKYIK